METQTYDKQEFFCLVAKQRGQTQQQASVDFPNTNSQLEGWRDYFQGLATPDNKAVYGISGGLKLKKQTHVSCIH